MGNAEFKKLRSDLAVRRRKLKMIFWVVGILILLVVLVYAVISWKGSRNRDLPGQLIPDQGREHVAPGHVHTYNSNPPTSGWHNPRAAEWGVYKEELPDEMLIHNLEHGGIWISYPPGISEDVRKKLESFYDKYGRKIIVEPRSKNDADIALAAWNRLDKFPVFEYSDERVEKFIKVFRNKGPEFVP